MAKRVIDGSRAIVTGASSGIGREIALALARSATQLIVVARREAPLRQLCEEIGQRGAVGIPIVGDVTDPSVQQNLVRTAESEFGGLDILVNNAGVTAHGRFVQASPQTLRQIMEVNFFAAAELIRASVPLLQRGNAPAVVNIGSILAHRAIPHNSEYCASKFALRGLSEAIRPELRRLGIDLILVSPGTTDTELFDHVLEKEGDLPWASPRGIPPSKVAQATVRALVAGKQEIIPNWRGRMLVWANRFAPKFVDRWMSRYG